MSRISPRTERGFSLAETLVALLVTIVITGVAMSLMARTKQASDVGTPMAERTWTRASALADMVATIRDSAAKCAYFDLERTVASIVRDPGGGTSGPPPGYCHVVEHDPATWPPGFDPNDRRTWRAVAWWDGASPDDPSTWYYDCAGKGGAGAREAPTPGSQNGSAASSLAAGGGGGTRPPSSIPHEFTVAPVASYGTGIGVGKELELRGPVAVLPESSALGGEQVGEALMVLRSEPRVAPLRLGATLTTSSGVIRLVGRDEPDVAQLEGLRVGDVLYVTGRDTAGTVRTALVALRTEARPIRAATPSDGGGTPVFQFFEAETEQPSAVYLGYLRNTSETASGAEFRADASVVLLARDGAVVTYYAARDETGIGLYRAVGDPRAPQYAERMVKNATAGLRVETRPREVPVGPGGGPGVGSGTGVTGVRIAIPVAVNEERTEAEPLEAELTLLNAIDGRMPVKLVWDALAPRGGGSGGGGR